MTLRPPCTKCLQQQNACFPPHFFLLLTPEKERKGVRKRGKDTSMYERTIYIVPCMHPEWGLNPRPRHLSWLGIDPMTLQFLGQCLTNWATPASAPSAFSQRLQRASFAPTFNRPPLETIVHLIQEVWRRNLTSTWALDSTKSVNVCCCWWGWEMNTSRTSKVLQVFP